MTLKHLRSSTANKRPQASGMADGQLAINTASGSPGLFFKDAAGNVVKIGPVHVGSGAPNVSPASGGTSGNSIGEQWLDNSGGTYVFKVWDGSAWRSESGEFVNVTGDTMTGSLTMGPAATLIFEGSVDDGFETILTVANPTADQTITLPNITGTVVTTGDTGTVTSTMIADGTIVNADVNASAAIAGTKISPDFGSQNLTSTGTSTAASFIPTSSGAPTNGLYLSAANTVALATNSAGRLFVDSIGRVGIGEASPLDNFHIAAETSPAIVLDEAGAGTDEKYWRMRAEGSILRFEGVNDAFSTATSWLNVTRSAGARTADNIAFATGTVEKVRINASGQVLIGSQGVSYFTPVSAITAPLVQLHATTSSQANSVIANWGTGNDVGPNLSLCRADSGAIGTYSPALGPTDVLGNIRFNGSDSAKFIEGARISAVADGTWAADNGPASLRFSTTPSGTTAVERLRITASGRVGIGTNLGTWTPGATLDVRSGSDNTAIEEIAAFARPDGAVRASINKGVVSGNGISFGTTTNHLLALRTNATERIVIGAAGTTTLTSDASTSPFIVNIDASEVARIDSSGKLLVGTSTNIQTPLSSSTLGGSNYQQRSIDQGGASAFWSAYSTTSTIAPNLLLGKSRGAIDTQGLVSSGDSLGRVVFLGSDGQAVGTNAGFIRAAVIEAQVDGVAAASGMPGRIVISTTASGSASPTERMRITQAGLVGIGTTVPGTARLAVQEATAGQAIVLYSPDGNGGGYIGTTNQATTTNGIVINANRGGGSIVFEANASERARIDSSGRLLVGATTARANYPGSVAPVLQVNTALGVGFERNTNDDNPIHIWLGKSRGTVAGANTIVNNGDSLAAINFTGADGSTLIAAAKISAEVDGTPGLNDMPGRIVLSTTADGASSPTERMRISNAGTTTLTSAASTAPFIANIGASEVARIDSSGRLLVGLALARTTLFGTSIAPPIQVEGTGLGDRFLAAISSSSTGARGGGVVLAHQKSGTINGNTALAENDSAGLVSFQGNDATNFIEAARIEAFVEGTVASGVMPGRLIFSTTASGALSPSERFRITNDGVQCYSQSAPATYASGVTLTAANLKTGIVQYSGGTATLALPTGSGVESGFAGIYTNMTFDWSVINTGSGICTVGSGIGHTVTGSAIVSSGTSGRFATRRTAANVFVSYRLS